MLSKMSRAILSRSMTIIKSAKANESLRFNHRKLGAILQIPEDQVQTDEQRMKLYTEVLSQKRALFALRKISPTQFLQVNSELQIILYTKYCIAKNYQKITPQAQQAMNHFFDVVYAVVTIIFSLHPEINQNHILWKDLIEAVKSFNQFYYLKTHSLANCMKYLKSAHKFKPHIQSGIFLLNFRFTLDTLSRIPLNHISQQNIYSIFQSINKSNIRVLYFNQSLKLVKHFMQPIKKTWYLQMHSRKIIIESMNRLNFYTQQILDKVEMIFKTKNYQFFQFTHLFNLLVKCKRINSGNFMEYQAIVQMILGSVVDSRARYFFTFTFYHLYMAGIWSPAYWGKFMKFIQADKHAVDFYNLYVLNQTIKIFKDQIPDYIHRNLQPMKRILEQNPNFKGAQMITDYIQKQKEQKNLDCQNQIANSLRIMSNRNIVTQQLIQFFIVDIIVDNKFIIEANGATHYLCNISNDQQKFPNHKTQFRTKMLAKLGYYVIDIDLAVYSEGSFQIIQAIFDILNGNFNQDFSHLGLFVTPPSTKPVKNNTKTTPKLSDIS